MVTKLLIGAGSALTASWVAVTVLLYLARPSGQGVVAVLGFLPQVVKLMARLLRDATVKRSARARVLVALLYNVQPINLIPDFLPVVGYLDNVVITTWALRSAVRAAGVDTVSKHWAGTAEQLQLLLKVARIPVTPPQSQR